MRSAVIRRWCVLAVLAMALVASVSVGAQVQEAPAPGADGERAACGRRGQSVLPDLSTVSLHGRRRAHLLLVGVLISALGMVFGLIINRQLKNMPVHQSMREISELIYETCKTYLIQQGKFLMILWLFIGAIVTFYFGALATSIDRRRAP